MPTKKVIVIEQVFEKVTFHVTGKDNFLHTKKIELSVYELAELLLAIENTQVWEEMIAYIGKLSYKYLGESFQKSKEEIISELQKNYTIARKK